MSRPLLDRHLQRTDLIFISLSQGAPPCLCSHSRWFGHLLAFQEQSCSFPSHSVVPGLRQHCTWNLTQVQCATKSQVKLCPQPNAALKGPLSHLRQSHQLPPRPTFYSLLFPSTSTQEKSIFVTSLNTAYFIKMLVKGWGFKYPADFSIPPFTHVTTWL